ncbi:MAG TPA: phage holin family protein [Bacillota bacterium]|nr:phage holin family protein [Bacillota bacterium]
MFLRWIVSLVIYAVAILAVDQLFETFYIDGFLTALIASFVISILNIFVRPILVLLTLPITFVTFGFFLLVINAATLMLAQWVMGDAFVIDNFGIAFVGAIIISIITMILNRLIADTVTN